MRPVVSPNFFMRSMIRLLANRAWTCWTYTWQIVDCGGTEMVEDTMLAGIGIVLTYLHHPPLVGMARVAYALSMLHCLTLLVLSGSHCIQCSSYTKEPCVCVMAHHRTKKLNPMPSDKSCPAPKTLYVDATALEWICCIHVTISGHKHSRCWCCSDIRACS